MKVTYLYHSGFVVEWDEVVFIFDYFRGELPDLKDAKQIFVFSSHRHYDHFKRKIFEWKQNYQNITYFLSEDIPKKAYMQDAIFMGPNVSKEYGDLKVRTLKSTDEGVAFLVHYKGKSLFHAGDLNWWHWEEEGSVFNEMMKRNYQYAISKIEGESIDIAFIPV
ncbi:MAG: MBL fold metallo-hydrolase, partial [Lachnospiraceae bacterium]